METYLDKLPLEVKDYIFFLSDNENVSREINNLNERMKKLEKPINDLDSLLSECRCSKILDRSGNQTYFCFCCKFNHEEKTRKTLSYKLLLRQKEKQEKNLINISKRIITV